jgi:hypothetical protein
MAADAHTAADFYGTARGAVTARLLRERLSLLWPDLRGQSVLGMGYAAPYLQIGQLLAAALFRVERRDGALFLPPSNLRLVLRSAPVLERIGHRAVPGLAGVSITEAVKDVYAAMPLKAAARRRLVLAETA